VAKRLIKKGHKVEVFCSKYPGYKNRRENGIIYTHIGMGTKNIRLNNIFYILLLPFIVKKIKADIIVECFTSPISTLFSPLFTKIPVVALPTSFEAERFAKQYHFPFHWIENFGLRFYKYFLPTSKYFEDKFKKVNSDVKTEIVAQGVDSSYLKIKPGETKYVVFMGRFDIGQKGLDLLLEAYKKVFDEIRLPLVLIGYGPDEKKVRILVNKFKLRDNVKIVGAKFGWDKLKILSNAKFFVVPSRHEGFCISALEALAVGIPVVCFNIPGLSWMSSDVSIKSRAFSVDDFARGMLTASKEDVNKRLRKNCKNFAKRFSWEGITKQYENFFYFMIKDSQS
jgi:glycosyltransferase involved in cell wall biosynthesis